MASTPGFKPGPYWWEASALNTAPPLLPELVNGTIITEAKRSEIVTAKAFTNSSCSLQGRVKGNKCTSLEYLSVSGGNIIQWSRSCSSGLSWLVAENNDMSFFRLFQCCLGSGSGTTGDLPYWPILQRPESQFGYVSISSWGWSHRLCILNLPH